MFGFFFNDKLPLNMKEVSSSNEKRFSLYHSHMLKKGFYFPCSMYEVCFMSNVISNEDIDKKCINKTYFVPIYNTSPGFPQWFKILSKTDILKSNFLISKLFRKALRIN